VGLTIDKDLEKIMAAADEIGVRLEVVGGVPTWELHPNYRHQRTATLVSSSLMRSPTGNDCGCISALDVGIRFPDGSMKRPDVSIFCREPDEQDELITLVPEAVVEVLSPGYEAKDLEIGPGFYLSQGVRDIIVVDPRSGRIVHFRADVTYEASAPKVIELLCGCVISVPA
jgi:Uma2 family endonuclease